MGRWSDIAAWVGTANEGDGDGHPLEPEDHMVGHVGVVLHIAEGTFTGTEAWQQNPASQVSSHFIVAKDGRVAQMVDTDDRSWCQVAGNSTWLSIEHEGNTGDTLPPAQLAATARIVARAHQVYGTPLQVSDSPTTPGLGYHAMGGTGWGGHFDCPGDPIINQRAAILAAAQQIISGGIFTMLTDAQQADMYRRVCNIDAIVYEGTVKGNATLAADLTLGDGSVVHHAPLAAAPASILSQAQSNGGGISNIRTALANPVPVQVDAVAVAAALAADTTFLAALAKAVNDDAARRLQS